jgi:hypothetical protein
MKTKKFRAALALACLLSACDPNVEKLLNPYVEDAVKVRAESAGQTVLKGAIPFKHTEYFTSYRQVCDREVCGYEREQRCYTREHCTGSTPSCHTVCHNVPDTVCRTDSNGQEHCSTTTRRECSESCSGGGRVCTPYTDCDWVTVPRYCDVNCRQVPYQDSRTYDRSSQVTVTVKGTGSVPNGKILGFTLGVHTNNAYQGLFNAQVQKPKEIQELLKTLSPQDKTLLLLKSEGYQLVGGQRFLELAPDFKAGDPVSIEVNVEPASNASNKLSGLGSGTAFPALHTSGNRD